MTNWYIFAIMALFFMGTQRFLYKVSAEKKCNTAWTTFSFMATVSVISTTLFFVQGATVENIGFLLFIACLNSFSFLIATIAHIEALKNVPAGVAYPIIRLNVVIVVIFSIIYFNDRPSAYQIIGIFLAIAVIVALAKQMNGKDAERRDIKRGLVLIATSMLGGSIASVSSKFAAVHTNPLAFIAVSYVIGTAGSFLLRGKLQTEEANANQRDAMLIGLGMGFINFAGYYSFLRALSEGPLSIIASITGMHFVIGISLSALIYKEKLTMPRILCIFMTIVSIILLRL